MIMKECVTHHYACDCREKQTRDLINGLIAIIETVFLLAGSKETEGVRLHKEQAKKLGYWGGK